MSTQQSPQTTDQGAGGRGCVSRAGQSLAEGGDGAVVPDPAGADRHLHRVLDRRAGQLSDHRQRSAAGPERVDPGCHGRRHDVRHRHVRYRPVDRLGPGVLRCDRGQGHDRLRRRRLGRGPHRSRGGAGQRARLGSLQRDPDRQGEDPAADRHPRVPGHGSRSRPDHHQGHRHPAGAARAPVGDRLRAAVRRPGADALGDSSRRRRGGRDSAAPHPVRPLHLRHRLQRGGGSPGRRVGRPAPHRRVRAVGHAGGPGRHLVAGAVQHHSDRRPVDHQPQRHRRRRHRRHIAVRRGGVRLRGQSSACSYPLSCRTGS